MILCTVCFEKVCAAKGIGIGWCADRIGEIESHAKAAPDLNRIVDVLERCADDLAVRTPGYGEGESEQLARALLHYLKGEADE